MFSTLNDRPIPRDISPRETNSVIVTDSCKRRRNESTDDHHHQQQHHRHQIPRPTPREPDSETIDLSVKRRRIELTDDQNHRQHHHHQHQQASSYDSYHLPSVVRETVVTTTHSAMRILTTIYPLTSTGYKYLLIAARIASPSYVDIALGDKQGKEICLSLDTWKGLIERKQDVLSCLRANIVDGARPPSPISIGDLQLRFGWINNLPIVRIDLSNATRLTLSLNTMLSLYDLEFCVNRIVSALSTVLTEIDEKYSRYREIAIGAIHTGTSVKTAMWTSEFFDPNNIVDCEITALCFRRSYY